MRVSQLWTSIADAGRDLLRGRLAARRSKPEALARDLLSTRGNAVGTALASELVETLRRSSEEGQKAFFAFLASELEVNCEAIIEAGRRYSTEPSYEALRRLRTATESPRLELFGRMNMAPGGTAALVALRESLLVALAEDPSLGKVDDDLRELLTGWLNPGFLDLVRIDWNSPASLLEKLIRYEKVHEIPNLEALHRRLGADRRCFAFFHPALPDEPLIFVQVALVEGMASKVQPLIEPTGDVADPSTADTAIFYSISNCQPGLQGVSLGNFLIKLVVRELARDIPSLRNFATLSPIPGFMRWFREAAARGSSVAGDREMAKRLAEPDWLADESFTAEARPRLEALCAHYLLVEKRHGRPRDPVARFHLNNGARLERINWAGDISEKGIAESAGLLVNYRYDPSSIERNHEAYANDGEVVASPSVRAAVPAEEA